VQGTIERARLVAEGKQAGGSVAEIDTNRKIRHGNSALNAMQRYTAEELALQPATVCEKRWKSRSRRIWQNEVIDRREDATFPAKVSKTVAAAPLTKTT
jgi:hypothetical protein